MCKNERAFRNEVFLDTWYFWIFAMWETLLFKMYDESHLFWRQYVCHHWDEPETHRSKRLPHSCWPHSRCGVWSERLKQGNHTVLVSVRVQDWTLLQDDLRDGPTREPPGDRQDVAIMGNVLYVPLDNHVTTMLITIDSLFPASICPTPWDLWNLYVQERLDLLSHCPATNSSCRWTHVWTS